MSARRNIGVWAHWLGMSEPLLLGNLYATRTGVREVFEFEYRAEALRNPALTQVALDPRVLPYPGSQYPPQGTRNFGLFLDSCPDRWGRMLMDRRNERARRQAQGPHEGATPTLLESDYLLGVHDAFRVGALRFTIEGNASDAAGAGTAAGSHRRRAAPAFMASSAQRAAPPFVRLRELEQASRAIESDEANAPELDEWLRILLAPGGSLGGARPKASVQDEHGQLWIAKFPSQKDMHDVGAWELVLHTLARFCGLDVPDAWAKPYASAYHTFAVQRFDRLPGGQRRHYASAMTLTGHSDGDDEASGASYLEIAAVLMRAGCATNADLLELWSRIVFNMCVSNTDDHLRNHGFLLEPDRGWRLSPAFDMNPVVGSHGLKLNVTEADNALDLDLALSVAPRFRVSNASARERISLIQSAVRRWPVLATRLGISKREQDRMAGAFALASTPLAPLA